MSDLILPRFNKTFHAGRLTADPELRYTPKGAAVCEFRIAVDAGYYNENHEWVKEAYFFNVLAWNQLAERCGERLRKGSPVFIEGSLKSRSYADKDDEKKKHWVIEIIAQRCQFLEKAPSHGAEESSSEPDEAGYEDPFES